MYSPLCLQHLSQDPVMCEEKQGVVTSGDGYCRTWYSHPPLPTSSIRKVFKKFSAHFQQYKAKLFLTNMVHPDGPCLLSYKFLSLFATRFTSDTTNHLFTTHMHWISFSSETCTVVFFRQYAEIVANLLRLCVSQNIIYFTTSFQTMTLPKKSAGKKIYWN